jgi:hypothetical protein
MKVFWSWQSDTVGKIGRYFVRSAIDEAVEALKQEPSVDEPFDREDETFEELHVDQDRQGVAGSPDLAATIFDKIGKAAVFIADITVIGASSLAREGEEPKKLINSNVAVELGYALGKLGGSQVLMVMNEFYGKREHLPFDLRGKGGPLLFKLSPQASKEEIETEKKRLKKKLKDAIGLCIGDQQESARKAVPFPRKSSFEDPALFRSDDEAVGQFWNEFPRGIGPEGPVYAQSGPSLWLRLMPEHSIDRNFSAPELRSAALHGPHGTMLTPLEYPGSSLHNLVESDGIGIASVWVADLPVETARNASAVAWIFDTGEIWSWKHLQDGKTITFFEKQMQDHLEQYATVLSTLGINRPYKWVAGLSNAKGFELEPLNIDGRIPHVGRPPECLSNLIEKEGMFREGDEAHEALLPFFEEVYRKCSTDRQRYLGRKLPY